MKKLILVSTGLMLAAFVNAEEIDQTLDTRADGDVDIYNTSGSVTVEGWSRDAVEVTGTLGEEVEEFIFERKGDTVVVKVKPIKGKRSGGRSTSSYITVQVPEMSNVDVATVSAVIDVQGVQGEQELQSVSGDVTSKVFAAELEVWNKKGKKVASLASLPVADEVPTHGVRVGPRSVGWRATAPGGEAPLADLASAVFEASSAVRRLLLSSASAFTGRTRHAARGDRRWLWPCAAAVCRIQR